MFIKKFVLAKKLKTMQASIKSKMDKYSHSACSTLTKEWTAVSYTGLEETEMELDIEKKKTQKIIYIKIRERHAKLIYYLGTEVENSKEIHRNNNYKIMKIVSGVHEDREMWLKMTKEVSFF